MTEITWDVTGERRYETGIDHGVLYPRDEAGEYSDGVAWNGLTGVTESPSGAEASPQYADNIKYLNLVSAEQFGGTIEAFTYPAEFGICDGTVSPEPGLTVGQQGRRTFGLSYRSLVGNDIDGQDYGYKLHLAYGCLASPSEKAYATVNDSPEAIAFSWEFSTTPVLVDGLKPTALLTLDSTEVDADVLEVLQGILYGSAGVDPRLPLPNEVIELFGSGATPVDMTGTNAPTYNSGTHVVTLPSVSHITWKINGITKTAGAQPALSVGQVAVITAHPASGYYLTGDDDWVYEY